MNRQGSGAATIDPAILKEAAQWLTRIQAERLDDGAQAEWLRWKGASAEHARAWEKAERLLGVLRTVPPELARTLERPARVKRRQVVKAVLGLAIAAPAGWLGWRVFEQQAGWAIATGVGQTRTLALQDGMSLMLNTDTEVKLAQQGQQRQLHLVRGELLLDTLGAALAPSDAVMVASDDGWLRLQSARLNLRRLPHTNGSQASVIAGEVQLQVAGQVAATTLRAGQQATFARGRIAQVSAASTMPAAWTNGVLYAEDMRLDEFIGELARYRHGYVICAPEVAALRISGVFQLKDTDRILTTLQHTLPVQVSFHTRWWVNVGAVVRT